MRVTLLGRPYEKKYVKGDVIIRGSLKKTRVKEDCGHIDPVVPQQG